MAAKTARSTATQRAELVKLETMLSEALAMIDSRYWATRSQREAYAEVLAHIKSWIDWEE